MENLTLQQNVFASYPARITDVPHMNLMEQEVVVGNIPIKIADYNSIAALVPPDISLNRGQLTLFEYGSMFFSNMGYTMCPSDPTAWLNGTTIENVVRDQPITYIPNNDITFNQEHTNLCTLIRAIFYWGRNYIECGYIVDEDKSFALPSVEEIKYNLAHHINIKRPIVLEETKIYWPINNIAHRRLHNICPHINPEYSYNCIRKFSTYAKQIRINHPCTVFVSAMIDPNIFFTMIRNSEIEACKIVNKLYKGYGALRDDYRTSIVFQDIINKKIEHLHQIYKTKGVSGLINLVRVERPQQQVVNTVVGIPTLNFETNPEEGALENVSKYPGYVDMLNSFQTSDEKRNYIEEFSRTWADEGMNEKMIKKLFNDLDKESLPESILVQVPLPEGGYNYGPAYWYFIARVHFIFGTMKTDFPTYFDTGEKWIVSKPFWQNEHGFALYNKKINKFVIAFPDMTVSVCNTEGAIKLYKDHYGTDVLLDADELGDSQESKAAPETILKDQIPIGDENKYTTTASISPMNLEVEAKEISEETEKMTKEEIAQVLAKKYNVVIK